jgi:hypothetical protein
MPKKLRVYDVRIARVWRGTWTAYSREEAVEMMRRWAEDTGDAEDYNSTTARPLREATEDEKAEYLGDTAHDEDESETR